MLELLLGIVGGLILLLAWLTDKGKKKYQDWYDLYDEDEGPNDR
jgi:hypothetical protein